MTQALFAPAAFKRARQMEGRATIELAVRFHFNFCLTALLGSKDEDALDQHRSIATANRCLTGLRERKLQASTEGPPLSAAGRARQAPSPGDAQSLARQSIFDPPLTDRRPLPSHHMVHGLLQHASFLDHGSSRRLC